MDVALGMSFERLELMAAAGARDRAEQTLDLAQAMAATWDRNVWEKKQRELIEKIKTGL